MPISNIVHVFSDDLDFSSNHQVIRGIELLAIPQGIEGISSELQIDPCLMFEATNPPMMAVPIRGCFHVYMTLSTYMRYSTIKLNLITLSLSTSHREAKLDQMESLTTAKVLALMGSDLGVDLKYKIACSSSEMSLYKQLLKAQLVSYQTSAMNDTLEYRNWVTISQDEIAKFSLAPEANDLKEIPNVPDAKITTITMPTELFYNKMDELRNELRNPAKPIISLDTTHDQPNTLQQQLDAAITQRNHYKGVTLKLMEFIKYSNTNQPTRDDNIATINVIFPKLQAKYHSQNPSIATTTLTEYLDSLFDATD
ncbi:Hypothetical protein MVR_LOCUS369 [uncultured virus]|nr:Hypothetical protein MVR_LOCUS369 [uncultured virus]